MCTAVAMRAQGLYFGRTLDFSQDFGQELTLMPRQYPLKLRHMAAMDRHYALLGVGVIMEGFPLFFDAVNEKGLAMAGLRFADSACYTGALAGKDNVAQFELIPWILGQCESVAQVRQLVRRLQITDTAFHSDLPSAPLHWLVADESQTLTLEATAQGLQIYDNPVGVLTNEPPFPQQMLHLANFMHLSAAEPENRFAPEISMPRYTHGLGAMGLPGDGSSTSRFVRAAFALHNRLPEPTVQGRVEQMMHILDSVSQLRGSCYTQNDQPFFTRYSICCDATRGEYFYTTWENRSISAVSMARAELTGSALRHWPMLRNSATVWQN